MPEVYRGHISWSVSIPAILRPRNRCLVRFAAVPCTRLCCVLLQSCYPWPTFPMPRTLVRRHSQSDSRMTSRDSVHQSRSHHTHSGSNYTGRRSVTAHPHHRHVVAIWPPRENREPAEPGREISLARLGKEAGIDSVITQAKAGHADFSIDSCGCFNRVHLSSITTILEGPSSASPIQTLEQRSTLRFARRIAAATTAIHTFRPGQEHAETRLSVRTSISGLFGQGHQGKERNAAGGSCSTVVLGGTCIFWSVCTTVLSFDTLADAPLSPQLIDQYGT